MKDTKITSLGAQLGQGARHYNLGGTDKTLIPIADATGTPYESGEVSGSLERTYFTVLLWNGSTPVTDDTGTIKIQGRATEDSHWQDVVNGSFDANTIGNADRTQAGGSGPLRQWRVLLTGLTSSTHMSACIDKYV